MRVKSRGAKTLLGAAALSLTAVLVGCSGGGGGGAEETPGGGLTETADLTVAVGGNSAFFWLHQIAIDEGFFEEEMLNVETVVIGGAPNIALAVQNGDVQFGVTSIDTVITAGLQGADLKVVGVSTATPIFSMMAAAEIADFEDLAGVTVGTSQLEQNTGLFVAAMFEGAGLDAADMDLVVIGSTSDRVAALRSGAIAASPVLQPQDFQLEEEGYQILAKSTDYVTDVNYIGNFASARWLEENPDVAQAYVNAMVKAAQFLSDPANKDASVTSLFNLNDVEEKYGVLTYEAYFEDNDVTVIPSDFAPTIEGMEGMAELMLAQDRFEDGEIPDVEQFLDLSFVEKALAD